MTGAKQTAAGTTPVVFVVDDDVSVRESLEALIADAGYRPEPSLRRRRSWGIPARCCLVVWCSM